MLPWMGVAGCFERPKRIDAMSYKGKSLEIARFLQVQIQSGVLSPGSQLETISALASRFQTTVVTVSKALDHLEEQGLVERFAGKGCYVKGRALRSFALVFDSSADRIGAFNYKPVLLKLFHRKCHECGYQYEIFNGIDTLEDGQELRRRLARNAYDAVLVVSRHVAENHAYYLADSAAVAIGLYSYRWMDCTVSISPTHLLRDGAAALAQAGCRQIGLAYDERPFDAWSDSPEDDFPAQCRSALRDLGLALPVSMECAVALDPTGGYEAAKHIFAQAAPGPLGIISGDTLLTIGIILAAAESERRLGHDLFLVSPVNPESPFSNFTANVIRYLAPVQSQIDAVVELARQRIGGNVSPIRQMLQYQRL